MAAPTNKGSRLWKRLAALILTLAGLTAGLALWACYGPCVVLDLRVHNRADAPIKNLTVGVAGTILWTGRVDAHETKALKLDTGGREGGVELSWQATSDGGQAKATFGYTTSWTPITEEIEFDVNGIHDRKAAPPRYLSDNTILGTLRLARSFVGDAFRHLPCVCQGWGVCG
jgi:hypothetical protein